MNEIMDNKIKFIVNNFSKQLMLMDEADVDEIYQEMLTQVTGETMDKLPIERNVCFDHILEDGTCCKVFVDGTITGHEVSFGAENIEIHIEDIDGFEAGSTEFDLLCDEDKDKIEQACLFALMDSNEEEV